MLNLFIIVHTTRKQVHYTNVDRFMLIKRIGHIKMSHCKNLTRYTRIIPRLKLGFKDNTGKT